MNGSAQTKTRRPKAAVTSPIEVIAPTPNEMLPGSRSRPNGLSAVRLLTAPLLLMDGLLVEPDDMCPHLGMQRYAVGEALAPGRPRPVTRDGHPTGARRAVPDLLQVGRERRQSRPQPQPVDGDAEENVPFGAGVIDVERALDLGAERGP